MPKKTKPVRINWGNLRHDEELDRLLNPRKPIGAEFAMRPKLSFPVAWCNSVEDLVPVNYLD